MRLLKGGSEGGGGVLKGYAVIGFMSLMPNAQSIHPDCSRQAKSLLGGSCGDQHAVITEVMHQSGHQSLSHAVHMTVCCFNYVLADMTKHTHVISPVPCIITS